MRGQQEPKLTAAEGLEREGDLAICWRPIEVLERIDTAEAREALRKLVPGEPNARVTKEAKAAVARMVRRSEAR